jgi:hypothetical protein
MQRPGFSLQIVALVLSYLNRALFQTKADFASVLPGLDLMELQNLLEPARLAQQTSLLACSQALYKRLKDVLQIEEILSKELENTLEEITDERDWTLEETRQLLRALESAGFKGSEEARREILARVLGEAAGSRWAAKRVPTEVMGYVQNLEGYFGTADEGGLLFAGKCFQEAVEEHPPQRPGSNRDSIQKGLPDLYAREDTELLKVLKASLPSWMTLCKWVT